MSSTKGKVTSNAVVHNTRARDNGAKLIFDDPILCAEFLRGYVDIDILKDVQPEDLLKVISKIIAVFLYRLNIPRKEVEEFTDQIERREFAMLFDSFEAYDVQETRRISREEGEVRKLVKLVCKKMIKNCTVPEIAEMLEEEVETIQEIYNIAKEQAPDFDIDAIMEKLERTKE